MMIKLKQNWKGAAIALATVGFLGLQAEQAQALSLVNVIDWESTSFTDDDFDQTVTSTTPSLGDIEITVTGALDGFNPSSRGVRNPATTLTQGGDGSGLLEVVMDQDDPSDEVTLTFTFSQPLNGIHFDLFDVDLGSGSSNFQDELTITGFLSSNPVIPDVTALAGDVAVASNVATGQSSRPNNALTPNVNVFFTSPIDQFEIVYGNNSSITGDPTGQGYAIGDITAVPFEAETSAGLALIGAYFGWRHFRQKKQNLSNEN